VKHAAGLLLVAALLAASPSAQAVDKANLAHIVVIVFENKEERQVIGSSAAPTFTAMARTYVQLTRYTAITHPSLPNYLALVSGSTHGIRSNCTAASSQRPVLPTRSSTPAAPGGPMPRVCRAPATRRTGRAVRQEARPVPLLP